MQNFTGTPGKDFIIGSGITTPVVQIAAGNNFTPVIKK